MASITSYTKAEIDEQLGAKANTADLGTAATASVGDFATAAQGSKADAAQINGVIRHTLRRPTVTFVSDDNSPLTVTKLRPLSIIYGIPMCAALITGQAYVAADYRELQDAHGWEIASHSDTHPVLPNLTDAQIAVECISSRSKLEAQGFNVRGLAYPGGMHDADVRRVVKQHFDYGISVSHPAGTNSGVIATANIKRVGLGAYFDPAVAGLPATNTLDYYKARVDQAVTEGSWLIFMLHPGESDATQDGYLESVIQYVQSLGIDVVTLGEAFDTFGNALESGDYNIAEGGLPSTGVAINKTGTPANFPNGLRVVSKVGLTAASGPTAFPAMVASGTSFLYVDTAGGGFPTRVGTLLTYRLNSDPELTTQVWYDYFGDLVYRRRWRAAGWESWAEIGAKDTGVRILTSWDAAGTITGTALPANCAPTPGVAGSVRVRRSGVSVTCAIRGATWAGVSTFTMPTGFGSATVQYRPAVVIVGGVPTVISTTIGANIFQIGAAGQSASAAAATVIAWEVPEAWPSLPYPGTPA